MRSGFGSEQCVGAGAKRIMANHNLLSDISHHYLTSHTFLYLDVAFANVAVFRLFQFRKICLNVS